MTAPVAVLRPEPGNAATVDRIVAAGHRAIACPLFAVHALDWAAPDPRDHDALLLTSANAVRRAGPQLAELATLPVYAVGSATARAARGAGLSVVRVGAGDADAIAAAMAADGRRSALWLAGRDRSAATLPRVTRTISVYASDPLPIADPGVLDGSVALLHSTRAAARLAQVATVRDRIALAAIAAPVLAAAGPGWRTTAIATAPSEDALLAAAFALAD